DRRGNAAALADRPDRERRPQVAARPARIAAGGDEAVGPGPTAAHLEAGDRRRERLLGLEDGEVLLEVDPAAARDDAPAVGELEDGDPGRERDVGVRHDRALAVDDGARAEADRAVDDGRARDRVLGERLEAALLLERVRAAVERVRGEDGSQEGEEREGGEGPAAHGVSPFDAARSARLSSAAALAALASAALASLAADSRSTFADRDSRRATISSALAFGTRTREICRPKEPGRSSDG